MRNSFATKMLSIAMMLLTPAAMLMAETGNTVLYASGNVMVNGREVDRSASVAAGDKIETAGATATAVSVDGSKVTVNPYSTVRYENDGVKVSRGTAIISTTGGMTAQAAQITVTPKDKAANYEIARLDNNVVITSHTGALMISEAGKTTELDAGGSSSRTAEPTPAPAAAATPLPAPQAAPVFPGSGLSNRDAWLIAAVVGGASIACGLLCGMGAAGVAPTNGNSVPARQALSTNHLVRIAQIAAAPVVAGVANQAAVARVGAARRAGPSFRPGQVHSTIAH